MEKRGELHKLKLHKNRSPTVSISERKRPCNCDPYRCHLDRGDTYKIRELLFISYKKRGLHLQFPHLTRPMLAASGRESNCWSSLCPPLNPSTQAHLPWPTCPGPCLTTKDVGKNYKQNRYWKHVQKEMNSDLFFRYIWWVYRMTVKFAGVLVIEIQQRSRTFWFYLIRWTDNVHDVMTDVTKCLFFCKSTPNPPCNGLTWNKRPASQD